jgi:hypothetical protein
MHARVPACLLAVSAALVRAEAHAFNYRFLGTSVLERLTAEDMEIGSRATRVALDSGEDG